MTCSEGLNTLGWGLGVSALGKRDEGSPSNLSAHAPQEPTLFQDPAPGQEKQRDKVLACKHYQKGWCRRGHECNFHHSDLPDSLNVPTGFGQGDKGEGRKVCPHFLKKNCLRGESCGYIHTARSADASAVRASKQPAQKTQVMCPHFVKGFCRRGQACRFAHVSNRPDTREAPPSLEVSRRVKRPPLAEDKKGTTAGRCDAASCRFSHRPLRQGEIELFGELLDGNDAQPEVLPANDQAPVSTSQAGKSQDQPQQDSVREGHQWDVTVPLLQPAPLILEPSIKDKRRLSA